MSNLTKCCKTCKWAKWELTPKGKIKQSEAGKCDYPKTILPAVPECENQVSASHFRYGIWTDMGDRCPVWQEKEGK